MYQDHHNEFHVNVSEFLLHHSEMVTKLFLLHLRGVLKFVVYLTSYFLVGAITKYYIYIELSIIYIYDIVRINIYLFQYFEFIPICLYNEFLTKNK